MEIIRQHDPVTAEELRRDFRPLAIWEGNGVRPVIGEDGRVRQKHFRCRVIQFVSTVDANKRRELITILGPATKQEAFVMPCDGEVEYGQALELFEWAKRSSAERAERSRKIKPERDRAFLAGISEGTLG